MDVGLYLDLRNPAGRGRRAWPAVYGSALELCEEADRGSARGVWLSEHHLFEDGYLTQPLTFAAAVAARTRRLRIGTAILIAPLRAPAHIAEEAVIVDILSHGRLDLGLGGGYRRAEFDLFGTSHERPLAQLFERVAGVRALLSDVIIPQAVQSPLPLWIGCNGPKGARRVGEVGEFLLSVRPELTSSYLEGLRDGGHDAARARMSGPVNIFLSDDPERDWPAVAQGYAYVMDSYERAAAVAGGPPPTPTDPERLRAGGLDKGLRGCLVTTPLDAARQVLAHFADVPVETIFSWAALPRVPHDLMGRHVELWSTTFAAAVKRATA
jgi:alkanesulfonate monooxygenase SsuD/methylene tetrahydromethanopterin reductase-like flavin-dependent oxidoreductase (luciferase family)